MTPALYLVAAVAVTAVACFAIKKAPNRDTYRARRDRHYE